MVVIVCPILAGDGVLGGLRGENRSLVWFSFCPVVFTFFNCHDSILFFLSGTDSKPRRIEDKFTSMGMEMKLVQIQFDLSTLHGNRRCC